MEQVTIHMMLKCLNLGSLMSLHLKFQKAKKFVRNFVYEVREYSQLTQAKLTF